MCSLTSSCSSSVSATCAVDVEESLRERGVFLREKLERMLDMMMVDHKKKTDVTIIYDINMLSMFDLISI